jgi:hypothetical protein
MDRAIGKFCAGVLVLTAETESRRELVSKFLRIILGEALSDLTNLAVAKEGICKRLD